MNEHTGIGDLLEYYERHLTFLADDDFYDTEALLALSARDEIEKRLQELSDEQAQWLSRLDARLVQMHAIVAGGIPAGLKVDRRHWWWFLHEGPQVREQAHQLQTV